MAKFLQLMTTTGTKEDAQAIAGSLVAKRLAGCVQIIGPITSTYWWEGLIEMAEEWLCLVKTSEKLYSEAEAAIRALHKYETPEILAIPVVSGFQGYLDWLSGELKRAQT